METFQEAAIDTLQQARGCNDAGGKSLSMKSKPVIVTCLLAFLSFILIFTQSVLNWIKNLTTDDRVWDRAMEMIVTVQNVTGACGVE